MATATKRLDHVTAAYERHFNFGLARMFAAAHCPIEERGAGIYLSDHTGKRYLDFATSFGVFNLGHCNRAVRAAVLTQAERIASSPFCLVSEAEIKLRKRLQELLPGSLNSIIFAGSGSDSTEVALRLAILVTGRRKIVSTTKGYHGKTLGALSIIGQRHLRQPFVPLLEDAVFADAGDPTSVVAAVDQQTAAVFVEPVVAGNYLVVPPKGYLAAIRERCDQTGALMVVDEVQTGFGRTGYLFGVDRDSVIPDIMLLSKALTGGHIPIAATAFSDTIAGHLAALSLPHRQSFESPSAGWPIACAAALAAIEETIENKLVENAAKQGVVLLNGLQKLAALYPRLIRRADGLGLMTGIILRNRAVEFALYLKMARRGIVTGLSLNSVTRTPVLRFYPPLTVSFNEIAIFLEALEDSLRELNRLPAALLDIVHYAARYTPYFPRTLADFGAKIFG